MNAKQQLHQAKLAQWAAHFKDQADSGLMVRVWCEQNNISIHSYNYWKHQLKSEYIDSLLPEIVPVPLPSSLETYQPAGVCSGSESFASSESPGPSGSCNSHDLSGLGDLSDSRNSNDSCPQGYLRISTPDIDISASNHVPDSLLLELIQAVRHA